MKRFFQQDSTFVLMVFSTLLVITYIIFLVRLKQYQQMNRKDSAALMPACRVIIPSLPRKLSELKKGDTGFISKEDIAVYDLKSYVYSNCDVYPKCDFTHNIKLTLVAKNECSISLENLDSHNKFISMPYPKWFNADINSYFTITYIETSEPLIEIGN